MVSHLIDMDDKDRLRRRVHLFGRGMKSTCYTPSLLRFKGIDKSFEASSMSFFTLWKKALLFSYCYFLEIFLLERRSRLMGLHLLFASLHVWFFFLMSTNTWTHYSILIIFFFRVSRMTSVCVCSLSASHLY